MPFGIESKKKIIAGCLQDLFSSFQSESHALAASVAHFLHEPFAQPIRVGGIHGECIVS